MNSLKSLAWAIILFCFIFFSFVKFEKELLSKAKAQKEEILLLRMQIADACAKVCVWHDRLLIKSVSIISSLECLLLSCINHNVFVCLSGAAVTE